jgi:hypothetical protein
LLKDDSDYEGSCADATDHAPKRAISSTQRMNDWWKNVLQSEKRRCEEDMNSRMIDVDDICLDEGSDDDNVPIVDTLPSKATNLSILATAASKKKE